MSDRVESTKRRRVVITWKDQDGVKRGGLVPRDAPFAMFNRAIDELVSRGFATSPQRRHRRLRPGRRQEPRRGNAPIGDRVMTRLRLSNFDQLALLRPANRQAATLTSGGVQDDTTFDPPSSSPPPPQGFIENRAPLRQTRTEVQHEYLVGRRASFEALDRISLELEIASLDPEYRGDARHPGDALRG